MNKNVFFIIVVLSVISIGGWYFMSGDATSPKETTASTSEENKKQGSPAKENVSETPTEKKEYQIIYTDSGYTPGTLEIKVGDSVTFKNESSAGMWTASNIHPTHTLYPEKSDTDCLGSSFDACEPTAPGDEWTFTFNEAGSWKYHNHVNARMTGTVIVR